ncbi:MAG: hypothetical protein JSU98_12580 [Gemmatimonadales bacterium]|nr:MAG: hypothetical protein JSU98_12580 [Gemmatimonadales bacterium]
MTHPEHNLDDGQLPESASEVERSHGSRHPWVRPEVKDLPRLNDLTLDTYGDPIGGWESVFA